MPEMNPVLILTRNNLELSQRAVASVRSQDIPAQPFIVDNCSSDGTMSWAFRDRTLIYGAPENYGVSWGWNFGLDHVFAMGAKHCLVIGNDTILAPWSYRKLLSYNLPFITGVAVDDMAQIQQPEVPELPIQPYPDFSCFLIRRGVWEKVGKFDIRMKHYASDCDYHIRAHRVGIDLKKACVPFYHERSSTMRNAPAQEQQELHEQANKDRETFRTLYNCLPGDSAYYRIFE